MNIAIIAFRWYSPHHYVPTWQEVVVTAAVICAEIWVFRWVSYRMPVRRASPAWVGEPIEKAEKRFSRDYITV